MRAVKLNEQQQELAAYYAEPHYEWADMYIRNTKLPRDLIDFMSIASMSLVVAAYHYDETKASFPTYVRRVFTNMIHDEQRKLSRDKRVVIVDHHKDYYEEDYLAPLIHEEEVQLVLSKFRFLPSRDRRLMSLRYTHGLTLKAVGEEVDLSKERVRQLLTRAIYRVQSNVGINKFTKHI